MDIESLIHLLTPSVHVFRLWEEPGEPGEPGEHADSTYKRPEPDLIPGPSVGL